jgi:hypothetical protein
LRVVLELYPSVASPDSERGDRETEDDHRRGDPGVAGGRTEPAGAWVGGAGRHAQDSARSTDQINIIKLTVSTAPNRLLLVGISIAGTTGSATRIASAGVPLTGRRSAG